MRQKLICEFIGTFFLVLAGTGAIVINEHSGGAIGHAGIAITFGLVVMTMIYAVGDVSGAHFNPAVSLGFVLAGRFPLSQAVPYVITQCLAALVASFLLGWLFPEATSLGETLPGLSEDRVFVFEAILTYVLMFVILSVSTGAKERGITAGLVVGGVIALEAMFAGPVTGASMNPARSLGPALVSGNTEGLWIYLSAPVLGAALASLSCGLVRSEGCCGSKELEAS